VEQNFSKGTFKYHRMLKEGGLLKPSEYRHMGGEGWPNRHITFIVAKKP